MAVPADFDAVIASLKLGWYVAEVRGRNRIDAAAPAPPEVANGNTGDALLLRSEQSAAQRKLTAEALLAHLAQQLNVDADPKGGASFTGAISGAAGKLRDAKGNVQPSAWDAFADAIFHFDESVQRTFAESSDSQSMAYQLGRALAESYWALDLTAKAGPRSWSFLLGEERCHEIVRLIGRLCPYFSTKYTGPSVSGSVEVWQRVASTPGWRDQKSAPDDLYEQMRRWYELLVLGQDPTTLVKPGSRLRNLRSLMRGAGAFLPQLAVGAASVAALVGGVTLANKLGTTLGAIGISLSAVVAKIKSAEQALTTRLRDDAYSDLICIATTVVPARTDADRDRRNRKVRLSSTRRAVTSALGDRKLTTAVSV